MQKRFRLAMLLTIVAGVFAAFMSFFWWWPDAMAAESAMAAAGVGAEAMGWGFVGAAVATGLAAIGAGFAVAHVGAAAIGAVAEKPELFGRLLILVGLAEGIAIYGLIISILILNRLG
jgi:V/A-type H+-transporting ATPase subunit K